MPFRDPRLANVSPHATCPPGRHSRAHLRPGPGPGRLRSGVRHVRAGPGDQRRTYDGGGGGAIFDRGGQLKVIDARFAGNRCDSTGPDLGGAAIRALSQYQNRAVEVTGSTFTGGVCSNGGALSSIGVSWVVQDSTFTGNRAIGDGANPAQAGHPGRRQRRRHLHRRG